MKIHNTKNGFTIVEMLLYIGLLSVMIAIMTGLFTSLLDVQLESEATSFVEADGRFLFSRFAYDIARATSIMTPETLGASSSTMTLLVDGVSYTYSVENGMLVLNSNMGTSALTGFGTKISNLTFTRLGNPDGKHAIQVMFTLVSQTERVSGPEEKTVQTTISLR